MKPAPLKFALEELYSMAYPNTEYPARSGSSGSASSVKVLSSTVSSMRIGFPMIAGSKKSAYTVMMQMPPELS